MRVYLRLTNNCNLKCGHCAYNSGPGGETLSDGDLSKVISHLPQTVDEIYLTGGEPMTRKSTVLHALKCLEDSEHHDAPTILSTNAFWLQNTQRAYEQINELAEAGLSVIAWSGHHSFQREAGLETDYLHLDFSKGGSLYQAYQKVLTEHPNFLMLWPSEEGYRSAKTNTKVHPFGRAINLTDREISKSGRCDLSKVLVDPQGNVHKCPWEIFDSLGSAVDKGIDDILAMAEEESIFPRIKEVGPKQVAQELGLELDSSLEEDLPCLVCRDVLSKS